MDFNLYEVDFDHGPLVDFSMTISPGERVIFGVVYSGIPQEKCVIVARMFKDRNLHCYTFHKIIY